jgi:hypothetical protein
VVFKTVSTEETHRLILLQLLVLVVKLAFHQAEPVEHLQVMAAVTVVPVAVEALTVVQEQVVIQVMAVYHHVVQVLQVLEVPAAAAAVMRLEEAVLVFTV